MLRSSSQQRRRNKRSEETQIGQKKGKIVHESELRWNHFSIGGETGYNQIIHNGLAYC